MRLNSYILEIAIDNIRAKKQRSLLSIIAISLSVAILYVALTLFGVIYQYSRNASDYQKETFHYFLESEQDEYNSYLYHVDKDVVYGQYGNYNNYFYSIHGLKSIDPSFLDFEGELPNNLNEIMVPEYLGLSIGDSVELSYQILKQSDGENKYLEQIVAINQIDVVKEYEVVGTYKKTKLLDTYFQDVNVIYTAYSDSYYNSFYYINDFNVQNPNSLEAVSEWFKQDVKNISINQDRIATDNIVTYLQNPITMLIMFVFIIIIAILMSVISIYNVLIVNDRDRRKELGLLKSIGVTTFELKSLLTFEWLILGVFGAFFGLVLGFGLTFMILTNIASKIFFTVSISTVINPLIAVFSGVVGIIIMVVSGFLLYKQYLVSSAIEDLKGAVVNYDIPYNQNRFSITSVTWRLFIIYNERIKKQTKNLRRSFFFMLLSITLFTGIAISNYIFKLNYKNVENHLVINQNIYKMPERKNYADLTDELYDFYEQNQELFSKFLIERRFSPINGYLDVNFSANKNNQDQVIKYEGKSITKNIDKVIILDDWQINELLEYGDFIYGNKDKLNENNVILIIDKAELPLNPSFMESLNLYLNHVSDPIDLAVSYSIDVVISIDFSNIELMFIDNQMTRIVGIPNHNYNNILLNHDNFNLRYNGYFNLYNSKQANEIELLLQEILDQQQMFGILELKNDIAVQEQGLIAVFMIEILMYTLLLMLVIIGAININNVLKGNMFIKRQDFSIMKSVGITTSQLRMIMIYEYIENYINAGFTTFLLCFPVYLLEKYVNIVSVFKIADYFVAMMMISFCILSPVALALLALNSFRELNKITAIENMNDSK